MTNNGNQPSTSLSEVHRTVEIPHQAGRWKKLLAFFGPAYLVSVGYMDPGNWATDIEGGARFGYTLLWVLLMSNLMAVLLQTLSARLGIVTGRDLAQACKENYPPYIAFPLWVLAEIAIAACDLAEVLGTAIGINLLFHIPLLWGVLIAGFDTLLLLAIQNLGVRKFEAFILSLVALIGVCFFTELLLSKPEIGLIAKGFAPGLPEGALYVAIGIIGATVMPHNLYLHSALVQTRSFDTSNAGKRSAAKYNLIDSVIALNAAFFVNAAILILAASTFHKNGIAVSELQQAHELLSPLLGTALAGILFAIALLAAGQSSTLTGTLAGQIIMEGFLHFKIRPFLRRLITRLIALMPAVYVLSTAGDTGTYSLLIFSQVVLSLQLPFAIIPLIHFTSDRRLMGEFANKSWVKTLAWISALLIVALNLKLVIEKLTEFFPAIQSGIIKSLIVLFAILLALLLIYVTVMPFIDRSIKGVRRKPAVIAPEDGGNLQLEEPAYKRIGVTVAFSDNDKVVLSHAALLARQHGATLCLFHIVEGVGGVVYGSEAFDAEAREDEQHLRQLADLFKSQGIQAEAYLGFGNVPKAIVRLAKEQQIHLLVMGGHGHRGLSDILFGATISPVRHELQIPLMIIR